MSYILEALRKADAQRERTRVPGLHAHPLAAEAPVPAQRWNGVMAALAAVGVVAAIAITWRLARPDAAPTIPAVQDAAPAPVAPTVQVAAAPAQPEPATAIVPPAPPPLPPQVQPERPVREAKAPAATVAPTPVPTASAVPTAAPAVIANTPPPGLPPLAVSGGVYSQNPAQRMLIVNGQVFNEGSEVASGVRLEQVRPDKKAVLNFGGQRFALPY